VVDRRTGLVGAGVVVEDPVVIAVAARAVGGRRIDGVAGVIVVGTPVAVQVAVEVLAIVGAGVPVIGDPVAVGVGQAGVVGATVDDHDDPGGGRVAGDRLDPDPRVGRPARRQRAARRGSPRRDGVGALRRGVLDDQDERHAGGQPARVACDPGELDRRRVVERGAVGRHAQLGRRRIRAAVVAVGVEPGEALARQ
jgi:hypothetical protein